jgi:hypothetical protein
MRKRIILFIFINQLYGTFFLNKYWVPELVNNETNPRISDSINFSLQPFLMHTNEANPIRNVNNQYIYELDGFLTLSNLEYNNIINNKSSIMIPSEWIANNYNIPLRLNGNIYSKGVAWNLSYNLAPWCMIGWSSGIGPMTGVINVTPEEEGNKYKLKESMLLQILNTYDNLSKNLGFNKNYTNFINFADQDFYILFCINREYFCYMRKIKFTGQFGGIVPTAHETDIDNPADIPGGINGFSAMYIAGYLDLLLKEDVSLNLIGKIVHLFPAERQTKLRLWTESLRFGGITATASINPGIIYNFSPTLRIDGLRRGLGLQLCYSTWGQRQSEYAFPGILNLPEYVTENMESISSWNQEHCNVTFFYDFTREASIDPCYKTMLSFSADIPVNFFFANNSGRSLGISVIFSCNF